MQDVVTSSVAFLQFALVGLIVAGIAAALGGESFFASSYAFQQAEKALGMIDYIALFSTTGFFIVSVGLAAVSRNNRIFLPISFLFLVVSVILSGVFSDVYVALASQGVLAQAASSLPILNMLAANMPLVFGVMGLTVIIALYTQLGGGRRVAR